MTQVNTVPLSLSEIEKFTGLSREVLRKWELRYLFPQPSRGRRGERLYSQKQAHRLRLLARLIDSGQRVGKMMPLTTAQLQAWIEALPRQGPPEPNTLLLLQQVQMLVARLRSPGDGSSLAAWLAGLVEQLGLESFVAHVMPAFNQAVGSAWENGQLGVHAEHFYTETVHEVVTRALPGPVSNPLLPSVLLTTPPGELHSLGLLALHAQLRLAGAVVFSLGAQTPVAEVQEAVLSMKISVVAVSVSVCLGAARAQAYLQKLRQALPQRCQLWTGGQGCAAVPAQALIGCEVFDDTSSAVLRWQNLAISSVADAGHELPLSNVSRHGQPPLLTT